MTTNILSFVPGRINIRRGLIFATLIFTALIAFETFNYSTTDFALNDLLGDLRFMGVRWATILAIAFCGIDFAGIARLFTPEQGSQETNEVWYLFGAWLLAATMNAMLTWWGVSIAILNHETLGNAVVERATLLKIVPIFVAIMVWLIRVLIIGTISVAGEKFFSQLDTNAKDQKQNASAPIRTLATRRPKNQRAPAASFRPASKYSNQSEVTHTRPEPTYQPLARSANSQDKSHQKRF